MGVLIVVEVITGTILLLSDDISQWMDPDRYRATASTAPIDQVQTLRMIQQRYPGLRAEQVQRVDDVDVVRGPRLAWDEPVAFVDPGTGRINAIGAERSWFMMFMVNVHRCALACPGYPFYQPWVDYPLPALGPEMTVAKLLLSGLGVLLCFIVLGGVAIWWPPRGRWRTAVQLRLRRKGFARHLDLHKLAGIVGLPFLFMWGFTTAAFYFQWPEMAYDAILPGLYAPAPPDPTPGTAPLLPVQQAWAQTEQRHPGAELVGIIEHHPTDRHGYYRFLLRDRLDRHRNSYSAGTIQVTVDSHGGGLTDSSPGNDSHPKRLWRDRVYNVHAGTIVPPGWRLIWLAFGLLPLLLAVSGATMWFARHRARSNRLRRRPSLGRQV
jgi:uncharacterized iron-regulated membrane protein